MEDVVSYLTPQEAAIVWDIPGKEHIVYRLIGSGDVRAIRAGGGKRGNWRIPISEIHRVAGALHEERSGLSALEIAEELRVGRSVIIRAMSSGEIPSKDRILGQGRYVTPEAYEQWKSRFLGEVR